jgi:hypothetical protein
MGPVILSVAAFGDCGNAYTSCVHDFEGKILVACMAAGHVYRMGIWVLRISANRKGSGTGKETHAFDGYLFIVFGEPCL